MAIPAAYMDKKIHKRIDRLEDRVKYLEDWVKYFIERDKKLKADDKTDSQKHVSALERRLQILENKLGER